MENTSTRHLRHDLHRCKPEDVNRLIRRGSDVNVRDLIRQETPLHAACTFCDEDKIIVLLKKGANMNLTNTCGETPLCKLLHPATNRFRDSNSRNRLELARRLIPVGFVVFDRRQPNASDREIGRDKVFDVFKSLQRQSGQINNLKSLCRREVRNSISGVRFNSRVHLLPLPSSLKQYIRFEDAESEIKCVRSLVRG